jgi:hypothetical protein
MTYLELFAEADAIGNKYQTPEDGEKEAMQHLSLEELFKIADTGKQDH